MTMSHVDDGTLHAYLDGELSPTEAQGVEAHLAQCPGCRGRLEEERALITRAGELLALAAPPDRALPPFRAGDLKPPPRLWWQVRQPLAWAATVVLALGIGTYLGNGLEQLPKSDTARDAAGDAGHELPSSGNARSRNLVPSRVAPPGRRPQLRRPRQPPQPATKRATSRGMRRRVSMVSASRGRDLPSASTPRAPCSAPIRSSSPVRRSARSTGHGRSATPAS